MEDDWLGRKKTWEEQIENILVGMSKERTIDNLAILVDVKPIVNGFNNAIKQIEFAKNSKAKGFILRPGNRNDDS